MIFHDFFGDVEPKSGAALALLGRKVGIEDFADLLGPDTVTGISDADVDVEILPNTTYFYGPLTVSRRLNRVNNDVLNGAGDLNRIAS